MSRSNSPLSQGRGGTPAQQRQLELEQDQAAQSFAAALPQGNRYAPAPQQAAYQTAPSAQQGYYPAPQQPSYQPVFDRYAAAPEPAQRAYDPRNVDPRTLRQSAPQRPAQQSAPSFGAPQQTAQPSLYDSHMTQQSAAYEQWQQSAAAPLGQPQQPAPRGYDFSNYMPAQAPKQDYAPLPAAQPPYQGRQPTLQQPARADEAQWQVGANYDRRDGGQDDGQAYAPPQAGYLNDPSGQLQAAGEQGYELDDQGEYEEEEPRKSRRGLVMVSALIGAIALGGGMAYGYKTFIKPPTSGGVVAKVSAPTGPAKTQPAEAGGKQFANQNSKFQERLGDGSAPVVATSTTAGVTAAAPDLEGGVKRVPTVVVGRDGSMTAPAGMVIVQTPPRPPAPVSVAAVEAPIAAALAVPQARAAAIAPQPKVSVPVAQVPVPQIPVVANASPVETAPVAAPVKKAAPKKPVAPRDDLAASGAPIGTAAAAPPVAKAAKATGSGFVAVVASKNSRSDAQKANADLEQRFDVLKGKVFDVQEADLSAQGKGVVYRSVVGPPGSRAYASGVCSELKAVGYTDCWPVQY